MERDPVASSMARTIGYDPASNVLEVEFHSGEIWQYLEVENYMYEEMMAGSIGQYFQQHIRNKCPERRIS